MNQHGTKARKWEQAERELCKRLHEEGKNLKQIGECLGRSTGSIDEFMSRSGLRERQPWRERFPDRPIMDFVGVLETHDNVMTGTPVKGRSALDGYRPPGSYGHGRTEESYRRPWDPRAGRMEAAE